MSEGRKEGREGGRRKMSSTASVSAGAIELKVFSEYYKIELDVVDIQTQRIDRFGT